MFIAKNGNLIITTADSEEELKKKLTCVLYTSIEEVEDEYILTDEGYKIKDEALILLKNKKQEENTKLAKEAVENGQIVYKGAELETNAQTVGDLTASMLLVQQAGLESYAWLTKDDQVLNLTLEDFSALGTLIAQYKNTIWNTKYIAFKKAIEQATTIEELEQIQLDYFTNLEDMESMEPIKED